MANDSGVSMREFARQIGRSAAYVSGKCKTGELPLVDGKIPLKEGLKAFRALIREEERKKAARRKPTSNPKRTAEVLADGDEEDRQIAETLSIGEAFNKARLKKEQAIARIKDLEYKQLKGEYVAVVEVEADAREAAAMLRNFAISAPTRYSALLENRTQREAEEVLEDIFRDMLKTIHGSRFAKGE